MLDVTLQFLFYISHLIDTYAFMLEQLLWLDQTKKA